MLTRKEPLTSGRETEIDMIEREMEGGVLVIQPEEDVHEHYTEIRLAGLVSIEGDIVTQEVTKGPRASRG